MIGTISDQRPSWEAAVEREARFLREVIDDPHATGAIIWYLGGEKNIAALHEARRRGLHLVFVDRLPPEGFDADFVGTANRAAARKAVSHLLELGHRRIACVPNLDTSSAVSERVIGYRQALREFDAPTIEIQFCPATDEPETRAFDRVTAEIIKSGATAVFTINDSIGLGLSDALRRAGISVPDDLSLVGFDGLLRWLPGGGPLTTLNQDFYRIGELACELLLERIEGGDVQAFRHIYLDAPLVLHGSTSHPCFTPPADEPEPRGSNEEVRF
jgi:LacI family transcriptional regulator